LKEQRPAAARSRRWHTVDQNRERPAPAAYFQCNWIGLRSGSDLKPCAIRWEHDARRFGCFPWAGDAETLQRRRQLVARRKNRASRRAWQSRWRRARAGESFEENRRG
jgi:hypothetical protein